MLAGKKRAGNRMLVPAAGLVFATVMQCGITARAAEMPQRAFAHSFLQHQSVSDNALANGLAADNALSAGSVSDNSAVSVPPGGEPEGSMPSEGNGNMPVPGNGGEGQGTQTEGDAAGGLPEEPGMEPGTGNGDGQTGDGMEEGTEAAADSVLEETGDAGIGKEVPELAQEADSSQLQSLNYKAGILTDWQQINEALRGLSADSLTGSGAGGLVLQLQNVSGIPAEIKDSLVSEDPDNTKYLHCNVGYGVALVFGGNTDNSGFGGISDASATVDSEKRGKKSMAVTVKFASHEDMGTVASLHVNLPQCSKGTKVSVYAETVSLDDDGNVTVGENACIGNTKADENGNVEVPIQSTANYMFVYKAAKE